MQVPLVLQQGEQVARIPVQVEGTEVLEVILSFALAVYQMAVVVVELVDTLVLAVLVEIMPMVLLVVEAQVEAEMQIFQDMVVEFLALEVAV